MNSRWNRNHGVSPVIAVILMVAVTVVLSAAIGAFVFDLGQSTADSQSQQKLGVSTSQSNGTFTVQVVVGSADELQILVNGDVESNLTNPVSGDTISLDYIGDGDRVTVISVNDGSKQVILQKDSVTRPIAPTSGLIAHYKLDAGSGQTAIDSEGNNDGTITGGKWVNGYVGAHALWMDGSDDKIDLGQINPPQVTASAWVRTNNTSREQGILLTLSDGNSASGNWHGYQLSTRDGQAKVFFGDGSTWHYIGGGNISKNTWFHLSFVHTGTEGYVYLNGEVVASKTEGFATSSEPLYVGEEAASYDYVPPYQGDVDDVRIYDRALTPKEMEQLYDATK